jgi:hypothetical protein
VTTKNSPAFEGEGPAANVHGCLQAGDRRSWLKITSASPRRTQAASGLGKISPSLGEILPEFGEFLPDRPWEALFSKRGRPLLIDIFDAISID